MTRVKDGAEDRSADRRKLRMKRPEAPFHIVLVEPEIPQNTGNIARLCAATGTVLHLVGRLGFRIDDKAVRRAGLDYWPLVEVVQHPDLETCLNDIGGPEPILLTTKSPRCYTDAPYTPGGVLVFGKETKGLAPDILEGYDDRLFAIPTVEDSVRSLNLANAVAIVLYEAFRAVGAFRGCSRYTPNGRRLWESR
jgi:tRNA (cytidine/uridine-2'-O-)-methyltransferase